MSVARSTGNAGPVKAGGSARARTETAPKPKIGTREKIKRAARRLFADHGVEAVSVRDIIAAAGAKNGGSLNYYFGSKDALIEELLTEIFREMSDAWMLGLSEIDRRGGPQSVRDIVKIIIDPPVPILVSDDAPTASRFLASMLSTRRPVVQELIERMHFSAFARLLFYIQHLRQDIPAEVMRQRLIFFAWYAVSVLGAYESYRASGKSKSSVWTDYDPLANIIDTGTGLLEADVSVAPAAGKAGKDRKGNGPRGASFVDAIFQ